MGDRRAVWGLGLALLMGACGGKSIERGAPGGQVGTGGSAAGAASAGESAGGAPNGGSAGKGGSGGSVDSDDAGAGGESGAGYAGSGVRLTTSEWNFNVTAQVTRPPGSADTGDCGLRFTLDLIDNGDSLQAFLGVDGHLAEGTFNRSPGSDALTLAAPIELVPLTITCPISSYRVETLTLAPAHGLMDQLGQYSIASFTGSGLAELPDGDVIETAPAKLAGEGYVDTTPPTVVLGADDHHPLDPISIAISEPLARAKVYLDGQPIVDFPIPQPGTATIRLESDRVLPFAQNWQMSGSASDFAGLPLTLVPFKTMQDPGPFTPTGFEDTPVFANLTGDALVIDDTYGVPIPNAKHALLIAPDGSATFRLKNDAAATATPPTLSMSFLELSADLAQAGGGVIYVESATIGGSQRVRHDFVVTAPFTAIDTAPWKAVSPSSTVTMPLPEQGSDVAVRFVVRGCSDPPCPPTALVIDDLKLQ